MPSNNDVETTGPLRSGGIFETPDSNNCHNLKQSMRSCDNESAVS